MLLSICQRRIYILYISLSFPSSREAKRDISLFLSLSRSAILSSSPPSFLAHSLSRHTAETSRHLGWLSRPLARASTSFPFTAKDKRMGEHRGMMINPRISPRRRAPFHPARFRALRFPLSLLCLPRYFLLPFFFTLNQLNQRQSKWLISRY